MDEKDLRDKLQGRFEEIFKEIIPQAEKQFHETNKKFKIPEAMQTIAGHKRTLNNFLNDCETKAKKGTLYPVILSGLKKPEDNEEIKKELQNVKESAIRNLDILGKKVRINLKEEKAKLLGVNLSDRFLLDVAYNKFKWKYATLMDEKCATGANKDMLNCLDELAEATKDLLTDYLVLANCELSEDRKKSIREKTKEGLKKRRELVDKLINIAKSKKGKQPSFIPEEFFGPGVAG